MSVDQVERNAWTEHRKQCEEGIIGGIMADPVQIPEVATRVRASDFTDPLLSCWFQLAVDLYDAGHFGQERLRGELRQRNFLDNAVDLKVFADLCEWPVSAELQWHASELRRMSELQRLRRLLANQAMVASEIDADPIEIAKALESQIEDVYASGGKLWEPAYDVARRVAENHRAAVMDEDMSRMGLTTGYSDIDGITGGYFRGQLWQIAARSFMGKSTVALAFAARQIERRRGVYVASYEMTNEEMMERMLADLAAVQLKHFTQATVSRDELAAVEASVEHFKDKYLLFDENPPGTVAALKARVKLAATQHEISLLIVDHLGLFPENRQQRHHQLVAVTRELKALAKELKLTVLLLNQLNIEAEGEEPTDKHYADAKGILANLDVSILLHRENKTAAKMLCKVTKNRKGAPGECDLLFDGAYQRVESDNRWNG